MPGGQADNCVVRLAGPPALIAKLLAGETVYMYYNYVLISEKDHQLYIGWSDDLINRLKEHQSGNVMSTKDRLPIKLVYYEACLSKEKAIIREKQLKSGYGRKYLKHRI